MQPLDNRQDLLVLVLLLRLDLQEPLLALSQAFRVLHNKPQVRVHYWEQIVPWLVRQQQVSLVRLVKDQANRQRCLDRNLANEVLDNDSLQASKGNWLDKVLVVQSVTSLNNRLLKWVWANNRLVLPKLLDWVFHRLPRTAWTSWSDVPTLFHQGNLMLIL